MCHVKPSTVTTKDSDFSKELKNILKTESIKPIHGTPYQHAQFNEKYHAFAAAKKAILRINRKPGEVMEVDWVGDTLSVFDVAAGCDVNAYVFVACLPCSMYGYAEAFPDMKSNHWITAHVHAYTHFGGVTRILVPDNLKTGVIKNTQRNLF